MSLPNFVNFEPFNALRRKMHAETLGRFDFRTTVKDEPSGEFSNADQTAEATDTKTNTKPRRRKASASGS